MAAFHEIGGVPCSGSRRLMTDLLRGDLGFEGMVVSDWNSIGELQEHGVAGSLAEAAAIALDAGVDLDMSSSAYITHIVELVANGTIPEEQLDTAVRRVLRAKFACGLFDRPYRGGHTSVPDDSDLKRDLARRLARRSIVLLKNDRAILPLAKTHTSLALIGPMANARRELLGTWSIDAVDGDGVTIAEGIRAAAPDLPVHLGSGLSDFDLIQAAKADIVVLALGEHHQRSGENASVASLGLPPGQVELARAVAEMGKPIVAVICAGRPLILAEIDRLATAIVYAWHPGIEGGNAIADILFGGADPSGKLPMTFPRHDGQIPIYYGHKPTGRPTEGQYIDMASLPLYPFGFGLAYTTFSYAPLTLSTKTMNADGSVVVSTCVTNTGQRSGDEVVQLYLRDPVASVTRPVRELKGFQRIRLAPGESQTVSFTIGFNELSYVGVDGTRRVDPGTFHVWIGGDSKAGQTATFHIVRDGA